MFKILAILCTFYGMSCAMDCSFGTSENALDKLIQSCPTILSPEDEKYCCPKDNGGFRCCDLSDFIIQWLVALWPFILLGILVCAILSCVCCCLRSCCKGMEKLPTHWRKLIESSGDYFDS